MNENDKRTNYKKAADLSTIIRQTLNEQLRARYVCGAQIQV